MSNDDFTKPPVSNEMNPYAQAPSGAVVVDGSGARTSNLAIWSFVLGLLSLFCSIFTGVIGFILGVVALIKIGGSEGKLKGSGFAIAGIICSFLFTVIGVGIMLPAVQQVRQAARRTVSMNNIRQLGLANLNYESANYGFPPIAGNSKGEGAELSWRVHILPFLDQQKLYDQFHLDEPWDSPHNKSLLAQMPEFYMSPIVGDLGGGLTVYLRPVGNGAFDDGDGSGVTFRDIADGSSNTILIVEANSEEAVPWTKPQDHDFDPANPLDGLGEHYPQNTFVVGMCDGSTHMVDCGQDSAQNVKALFTKAAGDRVVSGQY